MSNEWGDILEDGSCCWYLVSGGPGCGCMRYSARDAPTTVTWADMSARLRLRKHSINYLEGNGSDILNVVIHFFMYIRNSNNNFILII